VEFEWDEAKNAANLAKHGVAFEDAVAIFGGFVTLTPDLRQDYGEPRFIATGLLDGATVLVVVHTPRGDAIRIISARFANRREREAYRAAGQNDAG
jgi:uncharacterized DUF497 family protein